MSVIAQATPVRINNANCHLYSWLALTGGDTGAPVEIPNAADASIHVVGDFGGGATAVWEGSNDGVNYITLRDPGGTALSFTATGLKQILEIVRYARPKVTGGTAAALNFYLATRVDA